MFFYIPASPILLKISLLNNMESFIAKFLAIDRVPTFLPFEFVETEAQQLVLLQNTICDPIAQRYPSPISHRLDLLNSILRTCETKRIPVHERVYEELVLAMNSKSESKQFFGIYKFSRKNILFQVHGDSAAFVQNGSTGFVTWEAGKCLSWYLCTQRDLGGKSVLELGCGSGVSGIITSAHAKALERYIFTDYHELTLQQAKSNWKLNFGNCLDAIREFRKVDIMNHAAEEFSVDLLVGADILYDESLCVGLVELLESDSFRFGEALIFSTVRTEETFSKFIDLLNRSDILRWKRIMSSPYSECINNVDDPDWKNFLNSSTQHFDPEIQLICIEKRA